MRSSKRWTLRLGHLALVVALCLALELAVRAGGISRLILSPPSEMLTRLYEDFQTREIWGALGTTLFEVSVALVLCLLIGTVLGYIFFRLGVVRESLEPLLVAFYSAPAMLLYPFVMVFLDQGSATVITMAVVMGSAPIAINVAMGFSNIDRIWSQVGESMCASSSQMLTKILIPAAIPTIVTGFRLGLTFAMITVISLEFLTYSGGLGRLISWRYFTFDTDGVFSSILLVMTIAITINMLVTSFEGRVRARWQ